MSSSDFADSPRIGEHSIQRCDENRILVIDNIILLSFSLNEYRLLLPLLSGQTVKDDTLVNDALGFSTNMWSRANLDKCIDKLRSKLRRAELDVCRVSRRGYILLAT